MWRRKDKGKAAIRDGCMQIPLVALSLLLHEQKQTLRERKKYNAASLSERSSHDIRNHKAEAHARKEHGERGISWMLALSSNNQLLPSMHTEAWHEGGKTASKHSALKGSEAAQFALGNCCCPSARSAWHQLAVKRKKERRKKKKHYLEDNKLQTG